MIYITGVHLAGGAEHEHIARIWWLQPDGRSSTMTTEKTIEYMDKGNAAQVGGPNGPVAVQVVRPQGRKPYLRSHADGQWNNNLLELPRF